jgi:hypothetical protein
MLRSASSSSMSVYDMVCYREGVINLPVDLKKSEVRTFGLWGNTRYMPTEASD